MQTPQAEIAGNLQAKIMMLLREEQLCGVDLMKRFPMKKPRAQFTPVLDVLRTKGLIDYRVKPKDDTQKNLFSNRDWTAKNARSLD